jgi:hypothetical protein
MSLLIVRRRIPFLLITLLFTTNQASADPCAAELGKVDPGGAAAVTADEAQARQEIEEIDEHAKSDDADAQWKRKDAGKILKRASQHHGFETPFYAAGISKAMEKGDIKAATTLTVCVQRRGAQSAVDGAMGEQNFAGGVKATQEDTNRPPTILYDPATFGLDSGAPAPVENTAAPAPQTPSAPAGDAQIARMDDYIPQIPQ